MAVRLLMGKRNKARNGYRLHDYNGDGNGYRESYSDDEDDVFGEEVTSDGLLAGMSKPLMHPRDRTKVKSRTPECKCRSLCKSVLYFLLMATLLGGLVSLILYAFNRHTNFKKSGTATQSQQEVVGSDVAGKIKEVIGCDDVEVEDVWVVGFPKLLTESAFRLVDVNQDGVLDVIMGFATGADGYMIPPIVCDIYFNGTLPCFGGLLALEGRTGRELWRHYSYHELFALNCNVDLDGDGVKDCLGGGRAAAFDAVSGKNGRLLWRFEDKEVKNQFSNVYTPQYVADMDGDHVPDILIMHGGDPFAQPHSKTRESGRVVLMNGRTGKVLRWMVVPEGKETYYSPQVYQQADGTQVVLFGTGGETHGGSLWVITLKHLKAGRIDMARAVYTDPHKGVMTPPVLVDLTGDGTVDIVMNPFNSTVIALDGRTFTLLWNRTFPLSESYSTPAAGYFNKDDTPDFLVKAAFGPGFPVYYHAETAVLDGRTGEPLLKPSVRMSVGAQSSALSVSMEGRGHDLFLYWIADCLGHEGEGGEYRFVNGTNVHEKSRSDFCHLRFRTKLYTKMLALSSNIKPPGIPLYFSEERRRVERQKWVNTTAEAMDFLHKHPGIEREEMDRRKGKNLALQQLTHLTRQNEDYLQQPRLQGGDYPHGKKGPALLPQRQGPARLPQRQGPALPPQRQGRPQSPVQRRPSQSLPLNPQPRPQNRQYDKYSFYPLDNGYGLKDVGDGAYPSSGQGGSDTDFDNQGVYPYNLEQKHEYPGYYTSDRYRPPSSGYQDGYQPYKNYFQKRDFDERDSDGISGGFDDGNNDKSDLNSAIRKALLSGRLKNSGVKNARDNDNKDPGSVVNPSGKPPKQSIATGEKQGKGDGTFPRKSNPLDQETDRKVLQHKTDALQQSDNLQNRNHPGTKRDSCSLQNRNHPGTKQDSSSRESHNTGDVQHKSNYMHTGGAGRKTHTDTPSSGGSSNSDTKRKKPKLNFMKRKRRHVGPHDDNGLQRLLSTGTLAPSSLPKDHPDYAHTVDLVFATYWFFPAKTRAILPRDQACIDKMMANEKQRFDPKNKYYGMDHDAYGHEVTDECLQKSQHQLSDQGIYESLNTYDPFNIHMGQMTVYRLRIKCTCSQVTNTTTDKRCAQVLPYDQQRWPAYMGHFGDSFWLGDNT
ncbi:hypothetical protein ACOMHN_038168 [Nucella lapillus]